MEASSSSSSSRPARVSHKSSRTAELLKTIAELRERRAALGSSASASGFGISDTSGSDTDSPVYWQYDEEKPPVANDLVGRLDKLAIGESDKVRAEGSRSLVKDKPERFNGRLNIYSQATIPKPPSRIPKHRRIKDAYQEQPSRDGNVEESLRGPALPSKSINTIQQKHSLAEYEGLHLDMEKENISDGNGGDDLIFTNGKTVYTLRGSISKILYPHQREGIQWLWGLHLKGMGGILGDDMGLGKTMQIAAFLAGLFSSRLIKNVLIVAPKTLIAHWSKELALVGLGQKTKDFSGPSANQRNHALQCILQGGGILLTTYDVVRNNWKTLRGDFHGRDGYGDVSDDIQTWDYIVLDEGHLIKNPSTQRAKSLRDIPCAHRILLSGTPIQNNLREMWALFDFCCPDLLGDKKEFKARYEDAILCANSKDSTDRQKRVGSAVAQDLRRRIAPFFLRRMKSEVFCNKDDATERKLSRKTDLVVWLKLTGRQRELYTAFLESRTVHASLEGSPLAALTVLKKICDHPALLTKRAADDIAEGMENLMSEADAVVVEEMSAAMAMLGNLDDNFIVEQDISCKITFIMSLLEELVHGHRTLIFSQTRKMLDIIQRKITLAGYKYCRIDGTTKATDREKNVQEFQRNPDIPIFLLTSKVGGLGLTLTAADRVIIVDPAWNPSTDNQSVDRAYRIGQTSNVIIYRLMTSGSIEEKIYRKQVFKGGLFKVATEHKEQFRYFSHQELQELLSLPREGFDISVTQQQLHKEHSNQYESCRDGQLTKHIEFLESMNIAGVSHHDLLFSKQAPVLPASEEDAFFKWDPLKMCHVDGQYYADISSQPVQVKPRVAEHSVVELSKEGQIKQQKFEISAHISRLAHTLSDKATVLRLPDKGDNLRRKIDDLANQLSSLEYISVTTEETTPSTASVSSGLHQTAGRPSIISLDSDDSSEGKGLAASNKCSFLGQSTVGGHQEKLQTTTDNRNTSIYPDLEDVTSVLFDLGL